MTTPLSHYMKMVSRLRKHDLIEQSSAVRKTIVKKALDGDLVEFLIMSGS